MLDIVIPVFDDLPGLRATLAAFVSQTNYFFDLHVVCDGGNAEAARAVAQTACASFSYLGPAKDKDDPGRMAAVRNLGLKLCRAPRTLFLDGDCIPSPEVVSTHAKGEGVLVGRRCDLSTEEARRIRAGGTLDPSQAVEDIRLVWEGQPGELAHVFLEGLHTPLGVPGERIAWTCHVSYPTGLIRALGGFWEAMVGWGGEDNEMAERAIRAGQKVHTTLVPVYHLCHPKQPPSLHATELRDQSRANPSLIRNGGPL